MRGDYERLEDILQAIEKIEKHSAEGRAALESDERTQVWVDKALPALKAGIQSLLRRLQGGV